MNKRSQINNLGKKSNGAKSQTQKKRIEAQEE
jgi:hypothetical protein